MHRTEFQKFFKTISPAILPVIHVLNLEQTVRNIVIAMTEGAQGVFLINHDFPHHELLPVIQEVRQRFPSLWFGVNFLGVTGKNAFPLLGELSEKGVKVDACWADNARIDEHADEQKEADEIASIRASSGWSGLYFGGTAFKKQREVAIEDHQLSAEIAGRYMDVVTTSGIATGAAADISKIETFRKGCGEVPLAVASGVTVDNIGVYASLVDAVLVATGINIPGDFHNIDQARLRALISRARDVSSGNQNTTSDSGSDRRNRWYLSLMAPRSRGQKYAWLDPSSAYINAKSFHAMLDDLLEPFSRNDVDVVAGFDAAGFVLGAGMAVRLGKGFLTIRKGGKIPVDYDVVPMKNYSGQTQEMEMRKPAFAKGTRVLLVDQWIETGGTMSAGIQLVERQGGVVAGIAAVCIEDNDVTKQMYTKYNMSSCVVAGSEIQRQCNNQTMESFAAFKPEDFFPDIGEWISLLQPGKPDRG